MMLLEKRICWRTAARLDSLPAFSVPPLVFQPGVTVLDWIVVYVWVCGAIRGRLTMIYSAPPLIACMLFTACKWSEQNSALIWIWHQYFPRTRYNVIITLPQLQGILSSNYTLYNLTTLAWIINRLLGAELRVATCVIDEISEEKEKTVWTTDLHLFVDAIGNKRCNTPGDNG